MRRALLAFALGLCVSCGGSGSPSAPTPLPKTAAVQATVTTAVATYKGISSGQLQFELSAQVSYRETGGAAVTIQRVTGTIQAAPSGATSGGGLDLSLALPPFGSATDTYT